MPNFISISDTPAKRIEHILKVAAALKSQWLSSGRNDQLLKNQTLAMVFEKPSLRTRVSFAVAMTQLGGNGLLLRDEEVGLGKREPVKDVARVLASMCDGIMARTFSHDSVVELAKWSSVPVINGLTDYSHPCQALADVMTLREHFGELKGRTVAYIGDANNVTRSLASACGKFEMDFVIAAPRRYQLSDEELTRIRQQNPQMKLTQTIDPIDAVKSADCLYTDTWVSMGQEAEKAQRVEDFAGFQIDSKLLAAAPKRAVVLHCLPAYRGLEISDEVVESPRSLVFQQAENRLHAQKGLLAVLMGGA